MHGISKKKNAPVIDWKIMQKNVSEMKKVLKYIDLIVTTINSGINTPILEKHPCQKRSDELQDNSQQDYIKLINKLQWYMHCSTSYCIHINKRTEQQTCKFSYPKEYNDRT